MEGGSGNGETQILVIPFPTQGHINPMLQFSKRLASKGTTVTFCSPTSAGKLPQTQLSAVQVAALYDGFSEGEKAKNPDDYVERSRPALSQSLTELLAQRSNCKFIVYDSILPWVLDIARRHGLDGAPFFTQSCNVCAIFYHAYSGRLNAEDLPPKLRLPSLPTLNISELPSFVYDMGYYPSLRIISQNQFSNIHQLKWIFINSFDLLEIEVVNWMKSRWPVKTIGPMIPSVYLDGRVEGDREYGLNLFKSSADGCVEWLDTKEPASVVYVSFGSLAKLGGEQMAELSSGLRQSGRPFLWVVRESEVENLLAEFVAEMECGGRGRVVGWCNQLEVLAHGAVGCFVSHCGWNSTVEALSLGVPMVALPQWTDQPTNAKLVEEVWGTGRRASRDGRGMVTREEVELRIEEVMGSGENGEAVRRNAARWKRLAQEAVAQGGSSDTHLDEFVSAALRA